MDSYEIIVSPDAEADLTELRNYIAYELLVPDVARSYLGNIRTAISKLSYMGDGIPAVPDEPWHSRGICKISAKNFFIYFRVEAKAERIYILNVIYARRDQLRMLKTLKTEDES